MRRPLPPPVEMASVRDACREPAPSALLQGIREFNAREFYACHETLELLWRDEVRQVRSLSQGILLVGVSFYKVYTQHNFDGAVSLLDRGLAYLAGFPDQCQDVDVATLRLEAMRCRDALAQLGREQFRQLDPTLLPTIMVQEHDLPVASD